jgi:hypothetical protein
VCGDVHSGKRLFKVISEVIPTSSRLTADQGVGQGLHQKSHHFECGTHKGGNQVPAGVACMCVYVVLHAAQWGP